MPGIGGYDFSLCPSRSRVSLRPRLHISFWQRSGKRSISLPILFVFVRSVSREEGDRMEDGRTRRAKENTERIGRGSVEKRRFSGRLFPGPSPGGVSVLACRGFRKNPESVQRGVSNSMRVPPFRMRHDSNDSLSLSQDIVSR